MYGTGIGGAVKVTGDKELIAKLQAVKTTKAKAAIRKGSRAGSKLVLAEAKTLVPVKTGALKQAMKVRALPRSRKWTGTQITMKAEDVFYGAFVELGTKHMQAKKFLRDAMADSRSSALSTFIDGIKQELDGQS